MIVHASIWFIHRTDYNSEFSFVDRPLPCPIMKYTFYHFQNFAFHKYNMVHDIKKKSNLIKMYRIFFSQKIYL